MIFEDIVVGELIEECLEAKSTAAREHKVALEADIEDVGATLRGDRRLLRAALANLVDVAIRSSRPGGKITINYRTDPSRESIMVVDNGRGLHFDDLRSIRDLFCRAAALGNYEVEEIDPSLMGFCIVKDIADLHGGRVGVRSMEGEGSTFTLHLPRRHLGVA